MNNRFLLALATLVGTIIGGGIFGLPYVVSKSGILPGLVYFVALGGVVLLLHLMFGEIALRTQAKHRLIGYANIYLGDWAKTVVTFSTVVGVVGALLAYTIIAGDFLHLLLSSVVPLSVPAFSLLFWAAASMFIVRGIQAIAKMELFMSIALFVVVGVIFLFAAPHVALDNFVLFDSSALFFPYGVVLFAFMGLAAVPEIAELFKTKKEKRSLDNLIVWSSVICGALYVLFTLFVVGVSGSATSTDALSGLIPFLGEKVVLLGAIFGLIAIAASFLVLGNYLKNSLRYDYKMPYGWAVAFTVFTPIMLFLFGLREFIVVIGLVGAVIAALEGSVIALIFRKAQKRGDRIPEYQLRFPKPLVLLLVALLVLGAVVEVVAHM
ncbi:MAG TPA: aromatic amino acid transport family protein [Candidatus Paceibacterota bacterium]